MSSLLYKTLTALGVSAILCGVSQASELISSKTTLAQTDSLVVSVLFDTSIQGDLYLATMLPATSNLLFINENMQLTTTPTPYKSDTNFSGNYSLFTIPASGLTAGEYPLYELLVKSGASPYDTNNWLEGASGLKSITFTVLASSSNSSNSSNSSSTTTTTSTDIAAGKTLYITHCQDCHGTTYRKATSVTETRHAINIDDGGMGYLSFLTDAELTSIANYMTSLVGTSTSTRPVR